MDLLAPVGEASGVRGERGGARPSPWPPWAAAWAAFRRLPGLRPGVCAQALPWEVCPAGRSHMDTGSMGWAACCTSGARLRSMNSSGMPIGWRCAESRRLHLARLRVRVRVGVRVRVRVRVRVKS